MFVEEVPPRFVQQIWPRVGAMLDAAMAHSAGEYTTDQLKVMLAQGTQSLLVAADESGTFHGAASVAFENYPNERVAFITAIGGRLIADKQLFDELCQWARKQGCTVIRGAAFEAVARLWRQRFGVAEIYRIVEKRL